MASISELASQLKSMLKTKEDVNLLFRTLGTKDELLQSVECETICDDGKFHAFPKKVNVTNRNVACISADLWVRMEKYPYDDTTRIVEIIKSESDVESWKKYSTKELCVFEWQKYAVYSDDFTTKDYDEDVVDDGEWEHDGDHKDPTYQAFAQVCVYLYFHLTPVSALRTYKVGDALTVFFADLTGCMYEYEHTVCSQCQTKGDCKEMCTGKVGWYDDCVILDCVVKSGKGGKKLVSSDLTHHFNELTTFAILK